MRPRVVNKTIGGEFSAPVRLNSPPWTVFPRSYWITPPFVPLGWLTTTSPSRTSFVDDGAPPPMPTIKPNLMDLNVLTISFETLAAVLVPYIPAGKQAITIL